MNNNWMIMYELIDGEYHPVMAGNNMVPTQNVDKVIHVPKEIARQCTKFTFDGKNLKRKEGQYIMTLEQLEEVDTQEERIMSDYLPPSNPELTQRERQKTEIQF